MSEKDDRVVRGPLTTAWALDTLAIHAGTERAGGISSAIHQTSTFRWPSVEAGLELALEQAPVDFYARWGHPNARQLESIVARLEGAERAIATASGASAMTLAVQPWVRPGDHVILARTVYGETRNLVTQVLARFGVQHSIVASTDPDEFAKAAGPTTRVIIIETPANPTLDCVDIAAVSEIAHATGARLVVMFCKRSRERALGLRGTRIVERRAWLNVYTPCSERRRGQQGEADHAVRRGVQLPERLTAE